MQRKQIVFIMTDTQRWDMLGCYGNGTLKTPHLDRLAAEGVKFERAYSCQPVCGPARSAIFTGMTPHSAGVTSNTQPLHQTTKTIGQRLMDKGIKTGYIGKWHLDGGDYFGMGRCPEGWDPEYWYDMKNYLDELEPEQRIESRRHSLMHEKDFLSDFTFGHRVADRALSFIDKFKEEDFFLSVSLDEPHDPYICPGGFWKPYEEYTLPETPNYHVDMNSKPSHIRAWQEASNYDRNSNCPHKVPFFFGANSFADYQIGRVLDVIREKVPGAVVIYTSDHGSAMGSHGIHGKGPASYDEIARIPFIVKWPGEVQAGETLDSTGSHVDIGATVMDYFGFPIPKVMEGRSLLPVLKGEEIRKEAFIEYERYEVDHDGFGGFQPMRCIFDGRYKLTIHLMSEDELYDMESDPYEMDNLIESPDHREIRNRLHARLLERMNDTRDHLRGHYWRSRPWAGKDATEGISAWEDSAMTRQREHEEYEPRQLDYGTGLEMKNAIRPK